MNTKVEEEIASLIKIKNFGQIDLNLLKPDNVDFLGMPALVLVSERYALQGRADKAVGVFDALIIPPGISLWATVDTHPPPRGSHYYYTSIDKTVEVQASREYQDITIAVLNFTEPRFLEEL